MSAGVLRGIYLPTRRKVVFVDEERNARAVASFVGLAADLLQMLRGVKSDFKMSDGEAASLLADILSLVYRAPLLLPPVPHQPRGAGGPRYVFNNFDYFAVYVAARHLAREGLEVPGDVFGALDAVSPQGKSKEVLDALDLSYRILDFLRSKENYQRITELYEALLFTPADTRPGFNYTSLASHLTLTSLVLALRNPRSEELPLMRLAALFHDLGKLTNPVNHVEEGARIVRLIAERASSGGVDWAVELLEKLREKVYEHHEAGPLHDADVAVSASERLKNLVYASLTSDAGRRVRDCYDLRGRQGFDCFRERLTKEEYESLSAELYASLAERAGGEGCESPGIHAYIYYVNFPGVQSFIRNFPKLRDMSTASFLVDFTVSTLPFALIDQLLHSKAGARLPAEALLVGYGGHSFIAAPAILEPEEVEEAVRAVSGLEVRLEVSHAPFLLQAGVALALPSYRCVWEHISSGRLRRYYIESFEERAYSYGKHRLCDRCGRKPALPDPTEEGEYLCELCRRVYEVSKSRGLLARVMQRYFVGDRAVDVLEGMELEEFLEKAMYYIAGMDGEEKRYLAVFTFDGNNAGRIFGSSVTFSEYLDKSYLADYAIKKAYREALENLLARGERYVKSVLAGTVYLGGDEGLLLLPSAVAVDFASDFLSGASAVCGFTYKSGMVVVDPTHPVQFAVEASHLLAEKAKADGNTLGVVVSSNLVDARSLESLLGELEGYIRVKNLIDDHVKFVREAAGDKDAASRMLRALEKALRLEPRNQLEFVLYLMKEHANSNDERVKVLLHRIIREAAGTVGERGMRVIPVYDYYFMLKTYKVGGGID